jgi:hypothetical protein
VLRRKEALPEGIVELEIRQRGKHLEVVGANPSDELTRRITRMLQLDVDTSEFAEMARASERHAWVAETGFGRLLCGTTVWEDAVKIIATTNTTWAQTVRMVGLLVEKCGRDGAFPTPHDVLRFSEEELQRDCRLGYRAKSIRALATGIESGAIDPSWNAGVSPAEQAPSPGHRGEDAARSAGGTPAFLGASLQALPNASRHRSLRRCTSPRDGWTPRLHRRRFGVPPLRARDVSPREARQRSGHAAALQQVGTLEVSRVLVGALELRGGAFAAARAGQVVYAGRR